MFVQHGIFSRVPDYQVRPEVTIPFFVVSTRRRVLEIISLC